MNLKKRQEENRKAYYKDEARRRGYHIGYRMIDPENFVLMIYALPSFNLVREVPFTAAMYEYPDTLFHQTARRVIPTLPDLTVPAPPHLWYT